jgi:hypothetical protein
MKKDVYAIIRVHRQDNSFEILGLVKDLDTAKPFMDIEAKKGNRVIAHGTYSTVNDHIRNEIRNDWNFWNRVRETW